MIGVDDQESELSKPPEEPLEITSVGTESLRQSDQT